MPGAQNGILGDDNFGTELPQTQIPEEEVKELQSMAGFAGSREWSRIKEHLEQRIDFYAKHLPDGRPVKDVNPKEVEGMWPIANAIIGEYKQVIAWYEGAGEVMNARRTGA